MKTRHHRSGRAGHVLLLTLFMMVGAMGIVAFAVDLGYIYVVRSELQRSADASALAAVWKLCDEQALTENTEPWQAEDLAWMAAEDYAGRNTVGGAVPELGYGDVEIGYLQADGKSIDSFPTAYIAAHTHVRRTLNQNGSIPLFFAKVLGRPSCEITAQATAAFVNNFSGFGPPSSGSNLDILPLALDLETCTAMLDGLTTDDWTWNEETQEITSGPDGILEINLFPQGTGPPGNRGTVDIGSNNNSTSDIAQQILHGVSAADLAYHGGTLEFDENGELALNGDTGISAGVKDELEEMKGQPRIIPIFSQVSGNGDNATYTIVQLAGIRIVDVKLTGSMSTKRVIVQPAKILTEGGIPAAGDTQTSNFIYSPVWLVR